MNENVMSQLDAELEHAGEETALSPQMLLLEQLRITPEKELPKMDFLFRLFDNLTSKQFLTRSVTTASQNIVKAVERTINGKTRKIRTVVSLEDFRNPNGSLTPSPSPTGEESGNTSGNTGGNNNGGGDDDNPNEN